MQLELVNLWHAGELQRLLATVVEGDVTVNLVRGWEDVNYRIGQDRMRVHRIG